MCVLCTCTLVIGKDVSSAEKQEMTLFLVSQWLMVYRVFQFRDSVVYIDVYIL